MRRFMLSGTYALLLLASPEAVAADKKDPDWPCVQRKVSTISAGMIWSGPPIDNGMVSKWRSDKASKQLVAQLAARRTELEEAETLIEKFAADLTKENRASELTLLFASVLHRINSERQQIMTGIERYTRKQRSLAETVRETRDKLNAILKKGNAEGADKEKRRKLEETLNWQSRIHEERERSLQYVCESPVLLEQRAFSIARAIANHLP